MSINPTVTEYVGMLKNMYSRTLSLMCDVFQTYYELTDEDVAVFKKPLETLVVAQDVVDLSVDPGVEQVVVG